MASKRLQSQYTFAQSTEVRVHLPCVTHEDVQTTEHLFCILDKSLAEGFIEEVTRQTNDLNALSGKKLGQVFGIQRLSR